uniref:Uncharacterized protein n=1 Tax=Arundo donax TaxID=35708 RepID=A0A0A8ZGR8_ARUDO
MISSINLQCAMWLMEYELAVFLFRNE